MNTEAERTILVVEDDILMRKSITTFLQETGYHVLQAEDGQKGLDTFRRQAPDLVLLDLRMPRMDGLEVLEAITKETTEIPVIIVSGAGSISDAIKTLTLGAWDYVTKPITDLALLKHAVTKSFERAEMIQENRRYQNHLEEEVKKRTTELHQSQKLEAIGTLAGGIAHDFNNILSAILGYTEMAKGALPADSQPAKDLGKVITAGNRAAELVKQLLTFSRQGEQELQPVRIQYVIQETLKLLHASIPTTIEIREDIDYSCAPILADSTRIHQILLNLCTNAKSAMLGKGGILSVSLSEVESPETELGVKDGTYLILRVGDTGHGMDRDTMAKIFDPFFTTKARGEGTGLGLAVVHGIVTKLGGQITVSSKPGKGSIFQLYFPVVGIEESVKEKDSTPVVGGKERILVVDDEAELAEMIQRMLTELGYNVTSFANSAEALQEFTRDTEAYDLVISDMTMPVLTGTELARKILSAKPGIPIILCTGFSEIMDEKKAKAMGIREYIMKPVIKSELAKRVRKVLDNG
ncbi:MAG: response regulator [Desulfocapsa sp.]|nr:response regulator [Desulfocapsa sp.]